MKNKNQTKLFDTEPEFYKVKCVSCGEKFVEEVGTGRYFTNTKKIDEVYLYYSELQDGELICEGCQEADNEHASTVVKYDPTDRKEVVHYGDHTAYCEGDDIPDWFWTYFGGRKWHSTDAWRGYFETKWKNGFVKLAEGWLTGFPSETKPETEALDLHEFLEKNFQEAPAPIYWLYEPTSNLFSTASEIFVDHKDRKRIEKWLVNNGFNLDDINNAFS